MKTLNFATLLLLSVAIIALSASCASEPEKTPEEKAKEKMEESINNLTEGLNEGKEALGEGLSEAMSGLEEAMGALQEGGSGGKAVNFRELKKLAPKKIGGIAQTDIEGSTGGALGIKASTVEATYKDGDKRIELQMVDAGGMGAIAMAAASWATVEIDKESSKGFERTTEIDGHKAYEKCYDGRCEIAVIIAKRIIVTLNSIGLTIKELRDALEDIGLDDLEDLAKSTAK